MISFFYTFDYDDEVNMDADAEVKEGRPTTTAAMNAWVYAIAEKYEIHPLKAVALEKFWKHTKADDPDHMLEAAYTIFKHTAVSENDNSLKEMFCLMWLVSAKRLMDAIGTDALIKLNVNAPEFAATYMSRLTRPTPARVWDIRCTSCQNLRQCVYPNSTLMPEMNRQCSNCKSTDGDIEAKLLLRTPPFQQ